VIKSTAKKLCIILWLIYFSNATFAQKAIDDFTGKWKAPKGAIIIVTKTTEGFIGKTEAEDVLVLKDVRFTNNKWTAIVMNPKENLIAKCELVLQTTKLKIIAKKGFFHKTLYWVKQ